MIFVAHFHRKIYQAGGALLLMVGLSLMLTACGFHLKGMGGVGAATYKSVKLTDTAGVRSDILQAITQQFQAMGIVEAKNIADAEIVIHLQPTALTSSVTGRSAQGDVSSELLKMSQPFSAEVVATEQKIIQAQASAFRDRSVNSAQAQASNRELMSIQAQMANEVALQLIDRVNRAYSNLVKPAPVAPVKTTNKVEN